MISWDDELVQTIGRRRSVIVLGAGVSRNSTNCHGKRPATWEEFLRTASVGLGNPPLLVKLIEQKDYLTACELIKKRLKPDEFIASIQKEYQRPGYRKAEIHEHIYNLDSSIVISPNFYNIYDTYASSTSAGTIIIKDHTSQDIINYLSGGETRLLLKTHGLANTPGNVIFTRKDYAEARTKYVLFYEILKSLVLTHRFLFLGCGVEDPDIRALFEDVQFAHNRMPYHYMTIPKDEVDPDVLELVSETMKIRFYEYSPDNGHEELTLSLKELVSKVESYRSERAIDQKW
ncbi:SIR2 family protein [Methylomicrobium lacus]|uniref:SIR2 family protein n=1 Tax=Methylomicrobium lacus TaxID=136992 RepID=UPI0035A8C7B5